MQPSGQGCQPNPDRQSHAARVSTLRTGLRKASLLCRQTLARTRKASTRSTSSPVLHRATILYGEQATTAHPARGSRGHPCEGGSPPQPGACPHVTGLCCLRAGGAVGTEARSGACLHPDRAHLEQHAALPGESQEVGHTVAHVLEEGCRDCRLCHAGRQLGEQERPVRPQTHAWPDAKDRAAACGQALWGPADPPASTAPGSRSSGRPSRPAGASPTAGCRTAAAPCREHGTHRLRPPAMHKAALAVRSPARTQGTWAPGSPHVSTKSSGARHRWVTRGSTRTLSRPRRGHPRPDGPGHPYSTSEPKAAHFLQGPQRAPTPRRHLSQASPTTTAPWLSSACTCFRNHASEGRPVTQVATQLCPERPGPTPTWATEVHPPHYTETTTCLEGDGSWKNTTFPNKIY